MASKRNKHFLEWKSKYEEARTAFQPIREKMDVYDAVYGGTRDVYNKNGGVTKKSAGFRYNVAYRLIESSVDASVPTIRVDAIHREDEAAAESIQAFIRTEFQTKKMSELNDLAERICAVQGAVYYLVEWDNKGGWHDVLGDVKVSVLHPKRVIPQPGMTRLEDCEYIFVLSSATKKAEKEMYGVDLDSVTETDIGIRTNMEKDGPRDELVTHVDCWFKHKVDGETVVGVCSWADDVMLRYVPDYYARQKDGETVNGFELEEDTVMMADGGEMTTVKAVTDGEMQYATNPDGTYQYPTKENGDYDTEAGPIEMGYAQVKTVLPYYKPDCFPIVMRTNISKLDSIIGKSDVDAILDQQMEINKLCSKMEEKVMKGGSYVTLPQGVQIKTTEEELKVIRLKSPADKALIDVINVQPNIDKDMMLLKETQNQAQEILGLTNAFLGQVDTTATSGTAKQFSANQSAARLQSRRNMKYQFTAELAKTILRFFMAFSSGDMPFQYEDANGEKVYAHFNTRNLLKVDASGMVYWNDEFLFSVDESATLAANHETFWNMAAVMYQSGAFGPIGKNETNFIYWKMLKQAKYPGAGEVEAYIQGQIQQAQAQAMAQMMPTPVDESGMPVEEPKVETVRNNGVDDRTSVQPEDLQILQSMGMM